MRQKHFLIVRTNVGLICVTCTDMQVLCGNYPEVCFYKYGSLPLKGMMSFHEQRKNREQRVILTIDGAVREIYP